MKTSILTLITVATLSLATTTATFAATTDTNHVTVLNDAKKINSIEANGNVEIYIKNGDKDGVKLFDSYYDKNALVQTENGVLRITSYKNERLIVEVTVTDLRSISASGNAIVKAENNLSALDLDVQLNDSALAQLKLNALSARFNVNDHAKADVSGTIEDYELAYTRSSTVNRTNLTAFNRTESLVVPAAQPISVDVTDYAKVASL